jgi:hypothetical protein
MFPLCSKCSQWISAEKSARASTAFFYLFLIGFPIGLYILFQNGVNLILPTIIGLAANIYSYTLSSKLRIQADQIKPSVNCCSEPVVYLGWRGTVHTFVLTNPNFASDFQQSNIKKLVG